MMKTLTTKQLVLTGVMLALSVVGAQIKIFGSIAFDSAPAFLAAIIINPIIGGLVGLLGHLVTALTSGFPFTLPIHIVIALTMFISCVSFGFVYKKINMTAGIITGVVVNGPLSLFITAIAMLSLMGVPPMGLMMSPSIETALFTMPLVLVLTMAALLNIITAVVLYKALKQTKLI